MAIFNTPDIKIVGKNYDPQGSEILNTAGFNSGDGILGSAGGFLNNILGINKANSFYDEFLNSFLQTGNSLPLNNLWLVFIQDLPAKAKIYRYYRKKEGSKMALSWYEKASMESKRPRGVIIAQGVKHVGDGVKYSRDGYKNTGLLTGVYSNGRSELNELSISFLENNISFVDYALRPWAVSLAHEGLTNSDLVANSITVWHLGKMGERTNFAKRKVIKYHGCFPVSIDQQEYNYGGNGEPKMLRQVSFGYRYYTMESADQTVLDLVTYGQQENTILNAIKGFINKQAENVISDLKSQFGANSVSQYLNNITERAKGFGESLISNTLQGVVNNVAGGVQGAIDGAIRDLTSEGLSSGVNLVNSVANATNKTIDKITGANSNTDVPRGTNLNSSNDVVKQANNFSEKLNPEESLLVFYDEKKINENDNVTFLNLIEDEKRNDKLVKVEVNKSINSLDTPNNVLTDVKSLEEGGISIARNFASTDSNNDTPIFTSNTNLLYYFERSINEDDTPRYISTLNEINKKVNQNDVSVNLSTNTNTDKVKSPQASSAVSETSDRSASYSNLTKVDKNINQADTPVNTSGTSNTDKVKSPQASSAVSEASDRSASYSENTLILDKQTNTNDSIIGDELVEYIEKEINEDDSEYSDNFDYILKSTKNDDSTPSNSLKYKELNVNTADSNPSDSISYNEKNVKP